MIEKVLSADQILNIEPEEASRNPVILSPSPQPERQLEETQTEVTGTIKLFQKDEMLNATEERERSIDN